MINSICLTIRFSVVQIMRKECCLQISKTTLTALLNWKHKPDFSLHHTPHSHTIHLPQDPNLFLKDTTTPPSHPLLLAPFLLSVSIWTLYLPYHQFSLWLRELHWLCNTVKQWLCWCKGLNSEQVKNIHQEEKVNLTTKVKNQIYTNLIEFQQSYIHEIYFQIFVLVIYIINNSE